MSESSSEHPPADPGEPPAEVLSAWLAQSHDLLALTDAGGVIVWANAAFSRATGLHAGQWVQSLAPGDEPHRDTHALLLRALSGGEADEAELRLQKLGGAALWVQLRTARVGTRRLWTLQDITGSRTLSARANKLTELLDMAQEFGRLGVWEREIDTGEGRWDRHVFKFFGLDPAGGTPNSTRARNLMHPEDRASPAYADSIKQAGRYARRYRVMHANGAMRWIHSQWEVKNSAAGVPDRTIGIMVDDTETYDLARSLNAATAQLSLAAELGNIVIWRHDIKTGRVHYNHRGHEFLGMPTSADGLPMDAIRDKMHPGDRADIAASAERALKADHPVDETARYRRHDGVWRTLLSRRAVERDASGQPIAFVGVTLDVTEQAEQARRAQRLAQRLEAAARAGRMGIWSATIDADETEWNAQMFELFDRLAPPRPPQLQEWLDTCVHPDDARRVARTLRRYAVGGQGALETEFRIRTRDDRVRWIVLRADFHHAGDERRRVVGIALDVTDQHDVVTALQAASQRSALIAHHAGIGTWETDESGRNALWDEQMYRLRGLEPAEVAPDREQRLAMVHPDDRRIPLDADPIERADRPAAAYEFRVRWPDGSDHWLASRSAPLCDAHGRVVARMGVNWDITESKSADVARQQALLTERESQAKSRFLSRMSHELRTPLNAVLGFTQLLQTEARAATAGDRLGKLNHIRAAGEHLLALINDALELSGLESRTVKLDLQTVLLRHAVLRVLPRIESLLASAQVTIRTEAIAGVALADPGRLHQVLLNLLGNAIKNGRPGGEIVVASEVIGTQVFLRVADTGRQLGAEHIAHLFEPFNRLGVDSEGLEGSGIGLTIAWAMVESMGGEIGVASEPGLGTVFELSLPSADIRPEVPVWSALAPIPNAAPVPAQRSGCLLYIEDNEVNVLLVEELVRSLAGLRFVAEPTGEAGVAAAARLRPDVILIDLQLPDFDGFEVLRRLRAQPETAATPCIALSANAMPEDIARGRAAGFDDYWTKPIRFKSFLEGLEQLFPLPGGTASGTPG